MYPISSSYIKNKETMDYIDFIPYDQDDHLKVMTRLIYGVETETEPDLEPSTQFKSVCYPITFQEINEMSPAIQPIIPPVPKPKSKTEQTEQLLNVDEKKNPKTNEEKLMRKREIAREGARRSRKRKRDFFEKEFLKLKELEEKNKFLREELEKLKKLKKIV
jgi:hypothetical protein